MTTTTQTRLNNPFPGLRPFRFEESNLYFGREQHTEATIQQLLNNHFLSIAGASGVGKSSFVYCGIIHTLLNQHQDMRSPWRVIASTPSETPIMSLAKAVAPLSDYSIADLHEQMQSTEMALAQVLYQANERTNERYLLFFDQFEEIFIPNKSQTPEARQAEADRYIRLILSAIEQTDRLAYVVLTMRSEFLDNCTQYPALAKYLNKSQFILPRMTRTEIADALTKPITLLDASIEPALIERVLRDTDEGMDRLPIIQHAMMRTWERWSRTSALANLPVSVGDYEAVGTAKTALSVHANEIYAKLDERQKKICATIFKTVTKKEAEGRGVRQPTRLGEIAQIAEAPIGEVSTIIQAFRQHGNELLLPSQEVPLEADTIVDISHESLMRIWKELDAWATDEAESVKTYLRLAEEAEMYQIGKTSLIAPANLVMYLNWYQDQNPSKAWAIRHEPSYERAIDFLKRSDEVAKREQINKEKAQKRRLAFARYIAIGAGVGGAICLLFLLYALYQSNLAERQRKAAAKAADVARAESERAKVATKKANKEKERADKERENAKSAEVLAKEKAIAALRAKEQALQAQLQAEKSEAVARGERDKAYRQTRIAEISKEIADINNKIAILEKEKADIARRDVENIQLVSIAKTLALKSVRLPDNSLQAIAAQQAYIMNGKYNGKKNDPDIYQGLYYAVKTLKSKQDPHFNSLKGQSGHSSTVRSLITTGGMVYSTGTDGQVLAWNLAGKSYTEASTIEPTPIARVQQINRTMAVSNTGLVAVAGEYSEILVIKNGAIFKRLSQSAREIWHLGFAPDNKTLIGVGPSAVAGFRANVYIWNVNDEGVAPREILQSTAKINALSMNPVANNFVIGKENGELLVIDLEGKVVASWVRTDNIAVTAVSFDAVGSKVAVGDENGILTTYTPQGAFLDQQKEHRARINHIVYAKDGKSLATASFDRSVRVWNAADLNELPVVLDDHQDWVWSISFTPDGKKLLAGCRDNVLRVWPTQVEDMKSLICPDLAARTNKKDLSTDEWNRLIYKLDEERGEKPECTCCK